MLDTRPEIVARTYRNGNDLVIVLADGRDVLIEGFFVTATEKTVLVRDADSGDIIQITLNADGFVMNVEPRSLAQIEDMFATAGVDMPAALAPELDSNLSTQDGSAASSDIEPGVAIALGILGVAVLIAIVSSGNDGGSGSGNNAPTITSTTDGNGITAVDGTGTAVTTSTTTTAATTVATSTVFQYANTWMVSLLESYSTPLCIIQEGRAIMLSALAK